MLSGCAGNRLDYYQETAPAVDFRGYFSGPIRAWGIVQDWRGRVISRFDLQMVGSWDGDTGTLQEHFRYYSGREEHRTWIIRALDDRRFEGRAADIVGHAAGQSTGSAVRWRYVMDLQVEGETYRLRFDDWMWQMNDGVMINRSYMKKFGITVAELTVFMQKQEPGGPPDR